MRRTKRKRSQNKIGGSERMAAAASSPPSRGDIEKMEKEKRKLFAKIQSLKQEVARAEDLNRTLESSENKLKAAQAWSPEAFTENAENEITRHEDYLKPEMMTFLKESMNTDLPKEIEELATRIREAEEAIVQHNEQEAAERLRRATALANEFPRGTEVKITTHFYSGNLKEYDGKEGTVVGHSWWPKEDKLLFNVNVNGKIIQLMHRALSLKN